MNKTMAWAVAVLLLTNIVTGWAYLGQRDRAVTHEVREGTAVATAEICSKGTEDLGAAADRRHKDAGPARQAAADKNRQHQANAQRIQSTPPAVPGDECASARVERDTWWDLQQKGPRL